MGIQISSIGNEYLLKAANDANTNVKDDYIDEVELIPFKKAADKVYDDKNCTEDEYKAIFGFVPEKGKQSGSTLVDKSGTKFKTVKTVLGYTGLAGLIGGLFGQAAHIDKFIDGIKISGFGELMLENKNKFFGFGGIALAATLGVEIYQHIHSKKADTERKAEKKLEL